MPACDLLSAAAQNFKSAREPASAAHQPKLSCTPDMHARAWSFTTCLQENLPLDSPSSRRGTRAPSLHTHSLRLAKADSGLTMGSYQTKLRQQYQQSASDLLHRSFQRGSVCCAWSCCNPIAGCHACSAVARSALQLEDL